MVNVKNKRSIEMADEGEFGEAPKKESSGFTKGLIIIILIAIVILGGWFLASKTLGVGFFGTNNIAKVSNDWQAIFLTNGQVYFGKVKSVSNKAIVLNDIYYLQVVTKPLQGTQDSAANTQAQQELTLVKLGNEIHGPYDYMIINRDHVLLTERLKNDSRVVQAIDDYLSKKDKGESTPVQ